MVQAELDGIISFYSSSLFVFFLLLSVSKPAGRFIGVGLVDRETAAHRLEYHIFLLLSLLPCLTVSSAHVYNSVISP